MTRTLIFISLFDFEAITWPLAQRIVVQKAGAAYNAGLYTDHSDNTTSYQKKCILCMLTNIYRYQITLSNNVISTHPPNADYNIKLDFAKIYPSICYLFVLFRCICTVLTCYTCCSRLG